MHASLTYIMLWRVLAVFLLVGALAGALLGLLMIFRLQLFQRVNQAANRWISTQRFELLLDRSFNLEGWCHRHHRPVGIAIVLGALYILAYFGFQFDKALVLRHQAAGMSVHLVDWLLDALVLTALLGAAVSLCIGLVFWLRPNLLQGIEARANQWVSLRGAAEALDVPHNQVENFAQHHVRQTGWLLLLGSICLFWLTFRTLI